MQITISAEARPKTSHASKHISSWHRQLTMGSTWPDTMVRAAGKSPGKHKALSRTCGGGRSALRGGWGKAARATQLCTTSHEPEKSQETALHKDREKHCNSVPMGQGLATAPRQTQPSCSVQKFRATEQIISSLIALP